MTDLQDRINKLLVYSDSTRTTMLQVRQKAVERAEANLKQEELSLRALKCARMLKEFNLRMGQRIIHNKVMYVLAEVDGTGNPVGHRVKPDGSVNLIDRVALFRYRLERIEIVD